MGTRFEFVLVGPEERLLRDAGEEAVWLVEDAHRRLSRFEPGGAVHEINRAAGVASVGVDDEVLDLLLRCEGYRTTSGGAFNIVRPIGGARPGPGHEPGHVLIDADSRMVCLPESGWQIDLGGVAKGFALDLAARALREAGVGVALLHGGSSTIVAIGSPPGSPGWEIALPEIQGVVSLRNRALSVSSQTGDRPGHVIDPGTGHRAGGSVWAGCLGSSAEATDAWSTALVVLGERPGAMEADLTAVLPLEEGRRLDAGRAYMATGPDAGMVRTKELRPVQDDGDQR